MLSFNTIFHMECEPMKQHKKSENNNIIVPNV